MKIHLFFLTEQSNVNSEANAPGCFICQVVGAIDDQMSSQPSNTGVEIVSYSKLLSQVILEFSSFGNYLKFDSFV